MFCGTREPVRTLFENLRDGATIDEFLESFPGGRETPALRRTRSRGGALTESFLSGNPSAPSVMGLGGFERETGGVMFTGQSVAERCDTGEKENGHRAAGALLLVGARGTVAQARMPETRWPTRSTRSRALTHRCDAS